MSTLKTRIILRNDTAEKWLSVNPVLAKGELGYENDTGKFKFGDGIKTWSELPYNVPEIDLTAITDRLVVVENAVDKLKVDLTAKADADKVYTKEEVDGKISAIKTLTIKIANSKEEMVEANVLYLLKKEGTGNDVYEEYVLIDGVPTLIGETSTDLSGYVTTEEFVAVKKTVDDLVINVPTRKEVKAIAKKVEYEVAYKPAEAIVNYRDREIRVFCPADTNFTLQEGGGDANTYYMGFKAYAPDGAYSFKEDLQQVITDETMYYFTDNEFAGTDSYGRKYSIVWLPLAATSDNGATWNYYGNMSSVNRMIGWDYTVEWYDAGGKMIGTDSVRINLTNADCHNSNKITTDMLISGGNVLVLDCGNAE